MSSVRAFSLPLFVISFFCLLCVTACTDQPDSKNPVISMALASGPVNLDPRFATDATSERVNRLLYARLTELDDASLPVASMASWQMLSATHYRFTLLPGRRPFLSGRLPQADDVVASYRYVLDAKNLSPHRQSISLIQTVRAVDEQTVDFELGYADPLFPAYLAIAILPQELISAGHDFKTLPGGSGNFELVETDGQHNVLLKRREDGRLIRLQQVKDPTVRVLKLLNHEVDLLQNDISPEISRYLRNHSGIKALQGRGTNFTYIGFNMNDSATGNPLIREAIALAIDRQSIIDFVFNGEAQLAEAIFPADHWAGNNMLLPRTFNPDRSRQLLLSAGFDQQNPLQISYKTSSDPFRIKLATVIQSQLKQAGIEVTIQSYDWGTFFGDIKAGNFQMYSLSWVGIKTPDIFNYVFHSASLPPAGANRGRYNSARVDSLLDSIRQQQTLQQQQPVFRQVQQILHDELPYIPLWYEDQKAFMSERISGYHVSADGNYDALNDVTIN